MCDLVCDRYPVLLIMSRFGIALGFGDKTIGEVCLDSGVDTATFLRSSATCAIRMSISSISGFRPSAAS